MSANALRLPFRAKRWPLAARLAVLFVCLLAVVVFAFGVGAYRGMRDAASLRASERLASVARELAAGAARSAAARAQTLLELARMPAVRAAIGVAPAAGNPSDGARELPLTVAPRRGARADGDATAGDVRGVLAARLTRTDSTLVSTALSGPAGDEHIGVPLTLRDSVSLAATVQQVRQTGAVARSALYASGGEIHLWMAVPIIESGRTVGVLSELRRVLGSVQTEELIERLTGQDADVYLASRGSTEWASTRGVLAAPPLRGLSTDTLPDTGVTIAGEPGAERKYIAVAPVPATPWRIVLAQTETSILAAPREFLWRLLLIGGILIVTGAIAAIYLSRLETRALSDLRHAADAMAGGDYTQTVAPAGAEETAALAEAFNTMSLHISGVHTTLAEQNAALREANEAKARFLAVMSHELRTPLNAIGGHAELLSLGIYGPTTPEQAHALERIGRSKDQLISLVTDILHYARLEATPLNVSREPVSVRHQFEAVHDTVVQQFTRKGVMLGIAPSDATVCADPLRVQQVLINLVTNALQFTPAGGRVDVSAESGRDMTTLHVQDTGTGIPAEQLAAIFEPFVQADSSLTRRAGGAGLGLAIVRQLVTAMAGSVSVVSTPGHGSTFSVILPNADPTPEQAFTLAAAGTR